MPLEKRLADLDVCDLATTGRITGQRHVVELWFAAHPALDRLYILSGGRDGSDWVRNLMRDPAVEVRLAGKWRAGRAAVLEGAAEKPDARRALAAKYQGWREGRP